MNADRLQLMKPSAYLINVARGPIIEEAALDRESRQGRIAGAALDVFEREPPDTANPLLAMGNVISTAHCLCWTDTFVEAVGHDAITGIIDVINGRPAFVRGQSGSESPCPRSRPDFGWIELCVMI